MPKLQQQSNFHKPFKVGHTLTAADSSSAWLSSTKRHRMPVRTGHFPFLGEMHYQYYCIIGEAVQEAGQTNYFSIVEGQLHNSSLFIVGNVWFVYKK